MSTEDELRARIGTLESELMQAKLDLAQARARSESFLRILHLVDKEVRHHLRSEVISNALLRTHAVRAVRTILQGALEVPPRWNASARRSLRRPGCEGCDLACGSHHDS